MNLDSALTDIREGFGDEPVQKTISDIIDRISKIRRILDADLEIDNDAKYIIVDTKTDEEVLAADDDLT